MSFSFEGDYTVEFFPPGSVSSEPPSSRVSELVRESVDDPTDEEELRTPRPSQIIQYQEQPLQVDACTETDSQNTQILQILQLLNPCCQESPNPLVQLQTEVKMLLNKVQGLQSENSRLKAASRKTHDSATILRQCQFEGLMKEIRDTTFRASQALKKVPQRITPVTSRKRQSPIHCERSPPKCLSKKV